MACMDLHVTSCTAFPRSGHIGHGMARIMHLHEKRCIKRGGVAGIALRVMFPETVKNYIKLPNEALVISLSFFNVSLMTSVNVLIIISGLKSSGC